MVTVDIDGSFDRPPSDVYSCFGGFVFDECGYEGGYGGGSFLRR